MPYRYVKQMIADWAAMGKKFGGTAKEFYVKDRSKMILHSETVAKIHLILGVPINKSFIDGQKVDRCT